MDDAKLLKEDLLLRLEANRATHRETFEKAMEVYREKMTELLNTLIQRNMEGNIIPQRALYDLPMPEDHTRDYDVAIEMLKFDTRKKFVLTEREFRRYMMDQWEWAESFRTNTESYAASAR